MVQETGQPKSTLEIVRNSAFIVGFYLYFIGWVYVYWLYSHFGISFTSLDIPVYYFFVYSYAVASYFPQIVKACTYSGLFFWVTSGVVAIVILLALLARTYSKKGILVVVFVALFPLFFCLARGAAIEKAKEIRERGRRVSFVFKTKQLRAYPPEFVKANKDGNLKLLLQTKDKYYVFFQPPGKGLPLGFVYDLLRSDVSLVKIDMP